MKEFKCDNGRTYLLPDRHCAFCANCTDLFYDFTNGPYLFICNAEHEYADGCEHFVGDNE